MTTRKTTMNPNRSAAGASETTKGKRSGAVIDTRGERGGIDDIDAIFDAVKSPEPGADSSVLAGLTSSTARKGKKKVSQKSAKPMRMSLPSAREDSDAGQSRQRSSSRKNSSRIKKTNSKRVSWSPSELSEVSTAPPTPRNPDDDIEEEEEEEEEVEFEAQLDDESSSGEENNAKPEDTLAQNEEGGADTESREPFPSRRDTPQSSTKSQELSDEEREEDSPQIGTALEESSKSNTDDEDEVEAEYLDTHEQEQDAAALPEVRNNPLADSDEEDEGDLLPPNPPDDEFSNDEAQEETPKTPKQNDDGDKNPSTMSEKKAYGNDDREIYDDDDDHGDGDGYVMMDDDDEEDADKSNFVHDPETPTGVREERARQEKKKIEKRKARGRKKEKLRKKRRNQVDEDSSEDEDRTSRKTPKTKKKKTAFAISPQGYPVDNRHYETLSLSNFVEDSPEDKGLRRSRRARCKPLEFWRNEKLVYGANNESGSLGEAMGDMPVVTGILKALPTPHRKRKVTFQEVDKKSRRKKIVATKSPTKPADETPFDYHKLNKKGQIMEGETARVWDDGADDPADLKVVSYATNMEPSELPISKSRTKDEGTVAGRAAQGFNIPNDDNDNYVGYIMGNLVLPPHGIKDAESVGPCSQTFTVCHCQPGSLEVAYGDPDQPEGYLNPETAQRFYLGPGDLFRVPPGNCYRLENNSETTDCLLTWTIIRPSHVPAQS